MSDAPGPHEREPDVIEERKVTRYTPTCEKCGWRGNTSYRRSYAEGDLDSHPCGEHRQAHDSTGGFRGILGGYNVRCVCGERWVVADAGEPFKCPRTKPTGTGCAPSSTSSPVKPVASRPTCAEPGPSCLSM